MLSARAAPGRLALLLLVALQHTAIAAIADGGAPDAAATQREAFEAAAARIAADPASAARDFEALADAHASDPYAAKVF